MAAVADYLNQTILLTIALIIIVIIINIIILVIITTTITSRARNRSVSQQTVFEDEPLCACERERAKCLVDHADAKPPDRLRAGGEVIGLLGLHVLHGPGPMQRRTNRRRRPHVSGSRPDF
ncbi:hypothetical protein M433DRAFT_5716 [Acidomyces richmondensis BFW]|nr:MAG: hypothetical protein FE78DRAFT_26701 [Acidomyces sp. 'richmondensis']KYG44123.1 hypothetical protein M433DRAFT_5716 [Acidomyces richmondensis BFW]